MRSIGRQASDDLFISASMWGVAQAGLVRSGLPERFGSLNLRDPITVQDRFTKWRGCLIAGPQRIANRPSERWVAPSGLGHRPAADRRRTRPARRTGAPDPVYAPSPAPAD